MLLALTAAKRASELHILGIKFMSDEIRVNKTNILLVTITKKIADRHE